MSNHPYCPNFSKLIIVKTDTSRIMRRLRCKSWNCEYCADVNARQWQARSIKHIKHSGIDWSFITLTPPGPIVTLDQQSDPATFHHSLAFLRAGWDKLRHRMRRRYGKFQYLRVFEPFKSGGLHLHALTTIVFDDLAEHEDVSANGTRATYSRWLAENAEDVGMGWRTHAVNITGDVDFSAFYVVKYLSKSRIAGDDQIGRVRRIQTSQGWFNEKVGSSADAIVVRRLERKDVTNVPTPVWDGNTGEIITLSSFGDSLFYPPLSESD